jgi:hypothetical protein
VCVCVAMRPGGGGGMKDVLFSARHLKMSRRCERCEVIEESKRVKVGVRVDEHGLLHPWLDLGCKLASDGHVVTTRLQFLHSAVSGALCTGHVLDASVIECRLEKCDGQWMRGGEK